jgi:hypothetical protein
MRQRGDPAPQRRDWEAHVVTRPTRRFRVLGQLVSTQVRRNRVGERAQLENRRRVRVLNPRLPSSPEIIVQSKYASWIAAQREIRNACAQVTADMVREFPELRRVRGHYHCPFTGMRPHWWCVDPSGRVVDPTASQFPSNGCGEYDPWVEGAEEPTGKCIHCGAYAYGGSYFCSPQCELANQKYYR